MLIERLKHFAKGGSGPINDACAQAIDEIERLQGAKRKALHVADERSKENVSLRRTLEQHAVKNRGGPFWRCEYCQAMSQTPIAFKHKPECVMVGSISPAIKDEIAIALSAPLPTDREADLAIVAWMTERGYATGHGDTIADMLAELEAQAKERATDREEVIEECANHHTKVFRVASFDRQNYVDMAVALWPSLKWRHAGFGALQAYIREGGTNELRVHIWHPSLVKDGIEESGLCHDHRFDMRSTVLAGKIIQTEFDLIPDGNGDWQTWRVLHAREALARGGSFHHDPAPTGDYFRRTPTVYEVDAGHGYTFDKFAFHETRAAGVTVTLVEKSAQEDINARILAPRGKPIIHAFTGTQSQAEFAGALADALAILRALSPATEDGQ